jgi:hypothetical protein
MKRQYGKIMQRIAALMLGVFLMLSSVAHAAINTAVGDIAGDGLALDDSNPFELLASAPTLVKAAFLTVGNTALTDGDRLPAGTSIDFLIYINNETDIDLVDVGIRDVLAGFTYVGGSLHVLNTTTECALTLCTAAEELNIYNLARVAGVMSDALDGDEASESGGTIDVGNNFVGNAPQDAVANTVLALVFTAILN